MKHLNKERFMLHYKLRGWKENIRRLEVVKRELFRDSRSVHTGRNER